MDLEITAPRLLRADHVLFECSIGFSRPTYRFPTVEIWVGMIAHDGCLWLSQPP